MRKKNDLAPLLAILFGIFLFGLILLYITNKDSVEFLPWLIATFFTGFMFILALCSSIFGDPIRDKEEINELDISKEEKEKMLDEANKVAQNKETTLKHVFNIFLIVQLIKGLLAFFIGGKIILSLIKNPPESVFLLTVLIFGFFGTLLFCYGISSFITIFRYIKQNIK